MSTRRGASRRRSRQAALQALYAAELGARGARGDVDAEADASAGADTGANANAGSGAEAGANADTGAGAGVETDTDTDANANAGADTDADAETEAPERALLRVSEHFELPEVAFEFARELVLGVCAERDVIDAKLQSVSHNWKLARMSVVDRNVLRIAAFELGAGSAPPEVVINEAVELARRFGDDGSPRFVNGILGALLECSGEDGTRKGPAARPGEPDGPSDETPVEPGEPDGQGESVEPIEPGDPTDETPGEPDGQGEPGELPNEPPDEPTELPGEPMDEPGEPGEPTPPASEARSAKP